MGGVADSCGSATSRAATCDATARPFLSQPIFKAYHSHVLERCVFVDSVACMYEVSSYPVFFQCFRESRDTPTHPIAKK